MASLDDDSGAVIDDRKDITKETSLSIWGGLIDVILHTEGGLQLLRSDPSLKYLYERLQRFENVKTLDELPKLLQDIKFTEYERNRLNSPLLDQLYQISEENRLLPSRYLYSAIKKGCTEAIMFLLHINADIHDDDDSAFQNAAEKGMTDIVKLLLDRGANVHAGNEYALRWASNYGHTATVELLLDYDADIHADNNRALKWASERGHTKIVELLLNHGADIHADNDHALRLASYYGHTTTVKLLVERGANVYAGLYALRWARDNGHTATVELLQEWLDKNAV